MDARAEPRRDTHCQMLVDVGMVLRKHYGAIYSRAFLEEMAVTEAVILRVLANAGLRRMMHLALLTADQ